MKKLFIILFFYSCFYSCTTNPIISQPEKRPNKEDTLVFQALSYTSDLAKLSKTVSVQAILITELQKSQKKDSTNILALNKTISMQATKIKTLQDSSVFISPANFLMDINRVITIKK